MAAPRIIVRILVYNLGLFILALGVAVSINSDLGVSPVTSVPYMISRITNIYVGLCIAVIFFIYMLIQIILLRKEFKLINLTQIIFVSMFGYFVDIAVLIVNDFEIPTYFGRIIMILMSTILIGLGLSLYVGVRLIPMPSEGMLLAISQKIRQPFYKVKIVADCIFVIIAIMLSFIAFGELHGVREGTIISALLIGKVMGKAQITIRPILDKIC